jgi:transcription antitermination factor NusG
MTASLAPAGWAVAEATKRFCVGPSAVSPADGSRVATVTGPFFDVVAVVVVVVAADAVVVVGVVVALSPVPVVSPDPLVAVPVA